MQPNPAKYGTNKALDGTDNRNKFIPHVFLSGRLSDRQLGRSI